MFTAVYFEEVFDGSNEVSFRIIAKGSTLQKCKRAVLDSKDQHGEYWEDVIRRCFPELEEKTSEEIIDCYCYDDYNYYNDEMKNFLRWKEQDGIFRIVIGKLNGVDLTYNAVVHVEDSDFDDCVDCIIEEIMI